MLKRIDAALELAVARAANGAPPQLARALRYAVFPGGARVRPLLCLAVAEACGSDEPSLAEGAAVAIELLHCASLAHDDLPCFDDAPTRRGLPSLHRAFGQPLAVLTGDGLIVAAFETLALATTQKPERLAALLATVARAAGSPHGLVAGQALECEENVSLDAYHQAKTGALFSAASMTGAIASGHDPAAWKAVGEHLGAAYQVADDLLDAVACSTRAGGKPTLRDAALCRPNAVAELGVDNAVKRLRQLVAISMASVPPSHGADSLRALIGTMSERLVPASLKQSAA